MAERGTFDVCFLAGSYHSLHTNTEKEQAIGVLKQLSSGKGKEKATHKKTPPRQGAIENIMSQESTPEQPQPPQQQQPPQQPPQQPQPPQQSQQPSQFELETEEQRSIRLAKQEETDKRSVYVGNVDYQSTPEQLEAFFSNVGVVERITILFDKYSGLPKGYAYVEFQEQESVEKAIAGLNSAEFRNRELRVTPKRTNLPGFRPRGGFRGGNRGGFRGGNRGGFRGGRGSFRGGRGGRGAFRGGRGGSHHGSYVPQQIGESVPAAIAANGAPVAPIPVVVAGGAEIAQE